MKPYFVGIAGGTGSGKTTLARSIAEKFPGKIQLISMDSYYRDRSMVPESERGSLNFDHPEAIEFSLFREHLEALRNGRRIEMPKYDFATHCRCGSVTVQSMPLILVEGILLFFDESVVSLFDLKIFVDADADVRLLRRAQRDVGERGRTLESVSRQYLGTVREMHRQFVEPTRAMADIIVPDVMNPAALGVICDALRSRIL